MTNGFYYEFGKYRLNPTDKSLWRDNQVVALTPKQIEILLLLLENAGNTVSREEFFNLIWGGTFVEEANLTQNVFQLRKTLSENHGRAEFIETVPKRGYRFAAPCRKSENKGNPTIEKRLATVEKTRLFNFRNLVLACLFICLLTLGYFFFFRSKSNSTASNPPNSTIAILPFKEIGNQSDKQLEIGLADALITKLSGLKNIAVRPTSAVMQTKQTEPIQIGRELNVEIILSGTIQRENEQLRVTVQLVRVADGNTLWAETFDGSSKNIFDIQDEISEKILQTLQKQINPEENRQITKRHTNNPAAFEAYSRGRYFWTTGSNTDLDKSIQYFQKAIELDPRYALAYSGLADAQLFYTNGVAGTKVATEYFRLAKMNALKALEIDSSLAEPHTTLAAIIFEENDDWAEAEKEFLKAIEINPNYAVGRVGYSLHLLGQGDFEKAKSEMKKALEIDPVSPSMVNALGQIYYFEKSYDLAIEQFQKAIELDPDFARAKVYLSLSLMEVNRKEEALIMLEKVYGGYRFHSGAKTALGWLYANLGNRNKAQEILQELEKTQNPHIFDKYAIAIINAELGNTDKAFVILEEISKFRNLSLLLRLKFDPKINQLRQDKRFEKLLHSG
jgi:DNA-binding winged helix-turn-helix (wHTH) protein/TolB-like protein/Tfp pilus assembly protein PilF